MNPVRPFVERPIATLLLAMGVFVFGIVAWALLPVAALPQVDYPVINIVAGLPGAGPETMATAVAAPLERQLGFLNGVEAIDSFSSLGNTFIRLRFALDRNIDLAAIDVQSAISNAAATAIRGRANRRTIAQHRYGNGSKNTTSSSRSNPTVWSHARFGPSGTTSRTPAANT